MDGGLREQLGLLYRTHKQKTSLRRPPPHVDSDVRRQDAECCAASRLADSYRVRMCPRRGDSYRVRVRSGRRDAEPVRVVAVCARPACPRAGGVKVDCAIPLLPASRAPCWVSWRY